jgi:hypothetical protein
MGILNLALREIARIPPGLFVRHARSSGGTS